MYLQDRLQHVEGKQLFVAFHELDGLILGSAAQHVVALNSTLEPNAHILSSIRSAAPSSICFVLSGSLPSSRYDDFQYDGIAGYLKDLYDFQEALTSGRMEPMECVVTVLNFPLTHLASQRQLTQADVATIVGTACPLSPYLKQHKFNVAMHKVVRNFLKVNARFLDYLEIQALPDLLDARSLDWWIKENRRLYGAIRVYVQQTHHTALPDLEVYVQRKLGLEQALSPEELVRQRREEGKIFLHKPLYALEERKTRQPISDGMARLFQHVLVERSVVGAQDVRNVLRSEAPQGKDGREPSKTALPPPSTVTVAPDSTPAHSNAKGALLEVHQQSPQRYSRPEVIQETQEQGIFVLTVRLHDLLEGCVYTGSGRGPRKKQAEALACESVLQQMQERAVPPEPSTPKVTAEAVANPKGAVYELLQQTRPPSSTPSIVVKQSAGECTVAVTLSYQGQHYVGKGRGKTKKEAERDAFSMILEILDGRRTVVGLAKETVTAIERALHMGTGKNYIGQVHHLAQVLQVRPPQFLTTFHLSEEGSAYQTHASLQVTDEVVIEAEASSLFEETSKQEAALKLLSRLSELIRPGDERTSQEESEST